MPPLLVSFYWDELEEMLGFWRANGLGYILKDVIGLFFYVLSAFGSMPPKMEVFLYWLGLGLVFEFVFVFVFCMIFLLLVCFYGLGLDYI